MRYRKFLLFLLPLLLTACNASDNVDDIFTTHGWSFTGFCYTPNWNGPECSLLDITLTGYQQHQENTVFFLPNGTVEVHMSGCSLTGNWTADGRERTFAIRNLSVTSGSLSQLNAFAQKFYKDLCETVWYRGDSTNLQLFEAEGHYYLLFAPKNN